MTGLSLVDIGFLERFAKLVYHKARADEMESNQRIGSSEDAAEQLFNAAHKAAEAINSVCNCKGNWCKK